jgi:hypothetical protein
MRRLRNTGSFVQVAFLLACVMLIWKQSGLLVLYVNTSSKHKADVRTFATIPTNLPKIVTTNLPNNVPTTLEQQPQPPGILVVVPGLGDLARLPQLKSTLYALQQSAESKVGFACLVYVWKDALLKNITEELDFCLVEYSTGLWTHHMKRVGQSNVSSAKVESATHVALLLDDIDATHVLSRRCCGPCDWPSWM